VLRVFARRSLDYLWVAQRAQRPLLSPLDASHCTTSAGMWWSWTKGIQGSIEGDKKGTAVEERSDYITYDSERSAKLCPQCGPKRGGRIPLPEPTCASRAVHGRRHTHRGLG
jgi:hypothetical protein